MALIFFGGVIHAATIATVVGTGEKGFSGDGGLATMAKINAPFGVIKGPAGSLYICDTMNHAVRKVNRETGIITTFAGTGRKGYSGDGGPATKAELNEPYEVRFNKAGDLFFVEMKNHIVRRVDAKTRRVNTVTGVGEAGFSGDGGPASKARLNRPHSIQFGPEGHLYICDIGNHRIRRVNMKTRRIETFAGTGARNKTPDGSPIAGTPLNGPRAIDLMYRDKCGSPCARAMRCIASI